MEAGRECCEGVNGGSTEIRDRKVKRTLTFEIVERVHGSGILRGSRDPVT